MSQAETYTLPEAAFVLNEPIRELKWMIDAKIVKYDVIKHGGRKIRAVDRNTLVYIAFASRHKKHFSKDLLSAVYKQWESTGFRAAKVDLGDLWGNLQDYDALVQRRTKALHKLNENVEQTKDGEVVLTGADTEVHRISALRDGGATIDDIFTDYPSLTRQQVETARDYAKAHPKLGRSYPKQSAKNAMRNVDFSAIED